MSTERTSNKRKAKKVTESKQYKTEGVFELLNNISIDESFNFSTFHQAPFKYDFRLDNKGNFVVVEFDTIEQGLLYICHGSKPPFSSINKVFMENILAKIISAKTFKEFSEAVPSHSPNQNRGKGKNIGRMDWYSSEDYFSSCYLFMFELYIEKFNQYPLLKKQLLDTANTEIREISGDKYIGVGEDGTGKNFLGKVLMAVREHFKSAVDSDSSNDN